MLKKKSTPEPLQGMVSKHGDHAICLFTTYSTHRAVRQKVESVIRSKPQMDVKNLRNHATFQGHPS